NQSINSLNLLRLVDQIRQMGDPRTRDYPVVMNPLFVFPLTILYVYIVKVLGPRWMRNREPFQIINIVRVYNLAMFLLNARFCYILIHHAYYPRKRYILWCQGVTGTMDDELAYYYKTGWWYVAVRYADCLDTLFFVLRKKCNQIAHLHVIHHVMISVNAWFWVLFAPEGKAALGLAIDHTVMYSYYLLATLGPVIQKYLWWKKYLTRIQIIQNVVFMSHMAIPLFGDCGFPRYLIWIANIQTFIVMCMFINFYIQSYIKTRGAPQAKTEVEDAMPKTPAVTNGKND
ncbi:very long chain fatty acid elongase AAEL008004-like, partial [Haemaphysalis longicornis]